MNDIKFSVVTQEIVMKDNDFDVTTNPSTQNGGILAYGSCVNPLLPMYGVGIVPNVINGPRKNFVYLLNLWQQQAKQDGATTAKWSLSDSSPSNPAKLINFISYV